MYRAQKRSGIMLCYPFEEKRLDRWNSPVLVQPKLDGLRCRAVFDDALGYWKLISSEQNEFFSVPHINEALQRSDIARSLELDGELYCHGKSFEQIFSIVSRQENIHGDYKDIKLHLFDIVDEELIQLQRTNHLVTLAMRFPDELQLVPSTLCNGIEQIMQTYKRILELRYEGIIVRHLTAPYIRRRSTQMMKFKPKKEDWYTIIDVKEEVNKNGEPKGSLGALICEGDDGSKFSVGTGFSHDQRQRLWKLQADLLGRIARVSYQHITPGRRVPRFPVFVEIIDPEKWKEEPH